jgi:hypothetical protein
MSSILIARYVTPWRYRREQEAQRLHAIRQRDGDDCRRCRRPMRFDFPPGHDSGPKVETLVSAGADEEPAFENLCLCHRRCNAENADYTREVQERVRRKNEAELFSRSRKSAAKRA